MTNGYNNYNYSGLINILETTKTKRTGYKRTKLYGSSAAYCPRANFFDATHPVMEKEEPLFLTLTQKVGYTIEDYVLQLFPNILANSLRIPKFEIEHGEPNAKKTKLDLGQKATTILNSYGLNYSGIVDTIMVDENGNLSVIDVKSCATISNNKFVKVKDDEEVESIAKAFTVVPKYVSQITFYAAVTGINSASLLYISRLLTEEFGKNIAYRLEPIALNDSTIHQALHRAFFSQLCIENELLPIIPEEYKRGKTKYCNYCDYKEPCYAGTYDDLYPTAKGTPMYDKAQGLADIFMLNRHSNLSELKEIFGVQ